MMKSKKREVLELESELLRLATLVRERRAQLARLQDCPNPSCPCRAVWRDQVEKKLSSQVRKVRKQVRGTPLPSANGKRGLR
ncbi:MAG TPA: hypothetical protein VN829_19695 [Dongiaceae bacterium]|nr:hypothetical protein [Dongiaceae bacterium]